MKSRLDDLRDLRYATIDSAIANAFVSLVSGTILVSFITHIAGGARAADLWIGLITALPSVIGLIGIPGAIVGRRFSYYKKFIAPGGWAWRLMYIPLIALPLLAWSPSVKLPVILVCVLIAAASVQFISPIYNEWLAELVPDNSRGWYFGRRNAIISAVGAIVGLIGGKALDMFRSANNLDIGFSIIFGVGVLLAIISMTFFTRMSEMVRENPVRTSLREGIVATTRPFRDPAFKKVILFLGVFVLGQGIAGSLFTPYAMEILKMPLASIQLCGLAQAVGIVMSAGVWGFLSDKYGNKPMLALICVGIGLTPVMWMMCSTGNPYNLLILLPGHVFSGFVWAGVGVCQFNLLLATAKVEDRANYMGAAMAVQALVGGAAPMAGMALFHGLANSIPALTSYQVLFSLCIVLRIGTVAFLGGVKEEGATTIGTALAQLKTITPGGYRSLKQLSRSPDVAEREIAMEDVATRQFQVASDELVQALHDPSPRLRRKAAQVLSRVGDATAVRALIHQLEEHPDLVEDETIEALGQMGDPLAAPVLVRFLSSPRPQLRRAAAKALGELGTTDVVPALITAARDENDPDLRRAALQGLRLNPSDLSHETFASAMLDERPSVRIAAAEGISEHLILSAAPRLRESLTLFSDEATSEAAYALGCVGELSDIPQILQTASTCVSMITRRRCLLGVAAILGVERETYRLILLEGMSRDSAMLSHLKQNRRRNADFGPALEQFSRGDERKAIKTLCKISGDKRLELLVDPAVSECFLVAILAATK